MKNIYVIILTLFLSIQASAGYSTYFSPSTDLENVALNVINKANRSVDIAIYSFSSNKMRSLLQDKLQNGVSVRIVMEKGNEPQSRNFLKPLIELGARARYVTVINHHKFIIVDNSILLNSSGNFTDSRLSKTYDENLIVCTNCSDRINAYKNEFDSIFEYSNVIGLEHDTRIPNIYKNKPVHDNYEDLALFTSSNFYPYINSRNELISFRTKPQQNGMGNVDEVLVSAINNATDSIIIATGHFRSKPLYDALVNAVKRGIKIHVVLDGQEYISESKQANQNKKVEECLEKSPETKCYRSGLYFSRLLKQAGAIVKYKYYSLRWNFPLAKQMHHKYMLVDNTTLFTGSYNWSYNAEYKTFENVGVFNSNEHPNVIKAFKDNFKEVYNYGKDQINTFIESIKSATSSIPMHFAPMTITTEQIDAIRTISTRKCRNLYSTPAGSPKCNF